MADYQAKLHAMLRALRLARDAHNQGALSPIRRTRRNRPGSACGQKRPGRDSAELSTTRRAYRHDDHISVLAVAVSRCRDYVI
jgi:hypothetical protein